MHQGGDVQDPQTMNRMLPSTHVSLLVSDLSVALCRARGRQQCRPRKIDRARLRLSARSERTVVLRRCSPAKRAGFGSSSLSGSGSKTLAMSVPLAQRFGAGELTGLEGGESWWLEHMTAAVVLVTSGARGPASAMAAVALAQRCGRHGFGACR